jgi:ubiquinone/menaquinone biosynthesis C-methylase UbiE
MTTATTSKQYFTEKASDWDGMRKGFFSDNVREKAFNTAGVIRGATAADIGAGTGFITEGLVQRGVRVIAVDEVAQMMELIPKKVTDPSLVECRVGESEHLPLEDGEVDYAFANMYLHHVEHPDTAIGEIYRILKPGGRMVLTDLDSHDFEFLKTEHMDRWMGFSRDDIRNWFTRAGFHDVSVDCVGETCDSSSSSGCAKASISIFVASGVK